MHANQAVHVTAARVRILLNVKGRVRAAVRDGRHWASRVRNVHVRPVPDFPVGAERTFSLWKQTPECVNADLTGALLTERLRGAWGPGAG